MYDRLERKLSDREAAHLLRKLPSPAQGVDFISNDYLGFAREEVQLPPVSSGSGNARLIHACNDALQALEARLAHWYSGEHALIFNAGFEANYGLFSTLSALGYRVIYDEEVHASIRAGLIGARHAPWKFSHNDVGDLARKLRQCEEPPVVVTESVFSMSGHRAKLAEISALKSEHPFVLVVDEAHGTGTVGGLGGLTATLDCLNAVDIRLHTFGKALGAAGACLIVPEVVHSTLINYCRPLIYSTAPAPALLALIGLAHERFEQSASGRQAALNRLIAHWIRKSNAVTGVSSNDSPIQWLHTGDALTALALADAYRTAGLNTAAIRPPTVAASEEGVRISLHAFNTESEIDEVIAIYRSKQYLR